MSALDHIAPRLRQFYIDGVWTAPLGRNQGAIVNPATGETIGMVSFAARADVDRAARAAAAAFPAFSQTSPRDREALLRRILEAYKRREPEMAELITIEMGAPSAIRGQAASGRLNIEETLKALTGYPFEEQRGTTRVIREPVGVCALITPWNWPINQIVCKVAPALAAGCTMVLKPSELTPLDAVLFAEILDEAGVPAGVFNLLNGDGPSAGAALASHPLVDMVSFTGSTRAGIEIAKLAADTVKRVHQELGGKSANILLPDVDLEVAVTKGVRACYSNSGQSCNAPTRMLVPADLHDQAAKIAGRVAQEMKVGDPLDPATEIGPLANEVQFQRVQDMIEIGLAEGARLVCGGVGRPPGRNRGYFVRPTVFAKVTPEMTIAKQEIFGPVLSIMPYRDEDEAIAIANGTSYGLSSYVQSRDVDRARSLSRLLRSGDVAINYAPGDLSAPYGGYKQSGNGREYGAWAIDAFQELKAVLGYAA